MPFPLFKHFQSRKSSAKRKAKSTAASATKQAKAAARRVAGSRTFQSIKRDTQRVIEAGLKKLGKVGSLLGMLLNLGKVTTDEALEAVNQTLNESGRKAPSRPTRTPPKPTRRPEPQQIPDQPDMEFEEYRPRPAPGAGYPVQIGGRQRTYHQDDPTVSGEMIDVSSSNVHSIGFEFNWDDPMNGTLKVRFFQGKPGSKTAGPLYHYEGVHPDVFQAFRSAASKGKFVWDRLRIRGTVTGHRYRYSLKGIVGGYVPRQAKKFGQNQYFVGRSIKATRNGEIRQFESRLPDQRRGAYRPVNRGRPDYGRRNG